MDLLTESVWSVSCETKEFETAAYLENPEATKAEMQLLFSELKNYIESKFSPLFIGLISLTRKEKIMDMILMNYSKYLLQFCEK